VTTEPGRWRRWFRRFGIALLFLAAAVAGTAGGVLFAFVDDLPQISQLDDYSPGTITRVLGRDGALVGEFATERRVLVTYEQIPQVLRDAIVASEDGNFFTNSGIDIKAILAMVARRIIGRQHRGGASTITQQLARHLFLSREMAQERQTNDDLPLGRKIKEWLLAIQIEKRYTKPEIFTMYCNKMYWGHYVYGVEAASQLYFGKSVTDLNLDEAALIAGLLQGNVRQSPYVNMKAALERRAYVLDRMAERRFITPEQAAAAKARSIVVAGSPNQAPSVAPYFLESVRMYLEDQYSTKSVYEDGLTVKTGLDVELQQAANRALDAHLRALDKRAGFRKPARNVLDGKTTLESYRDSRWPRQLAPGDIVSAVVMGTEGAVIRVRVGQMAGTIGRAGYAWTRRAASSLVRAGDLIEVKVGKVGSPGVFEGELEQPPAVEGAFVALDNHTGQILAMAGGDSFSRSQFNRATQAKRQVGSLFKPFVYTAAIDKGYTAASVLDDVKTAFDTGPNQPLYEPQNYDREFEGPITLRRALEESRNVPAVAMMQTLGPAEVNKYPRLLGITTPLPEFLSVAIGAAEGTLLEMTSAYSAFPNQGVRMAPVTILSVSDREGNLLEQYGPEPHDALRADTAFIMTELLHGVVEHGTGAGARDLDWPLGGKTGTTDDYTDAWFIGFDPDITIGVWIGFDQKKVIADKATGTTVALPLWKDIMKTWVARRRKALPEPPEFVRPGNVVLVDLPTGPEYFIVGTEPGRH
jgi:penicillin-binding protein 1A